jgi:hypothetical protein
LARKLAHHPRRVNPNLSLLSKTCINEYDSLKGRLRLASAPPGSPPRTCAPLIYRAEPAEAKGFLPRFFPTRVWLREGDMSVA